MEFQEEIAQLQILQKQTLQKLNAFASQHLSNWTDCLEITQELASIRDRQRQRLKDGFSPRNHPQSRPEFQSLTPMMQFEQVQEFNRQRAQYEADERNMGHNANSDSPKHRLTQTKERLKDSLKFVDELQSLFENLSRIRYLASTPTPTIDVEEEQSDN